MDVIKVGIADCQVSNLTGSQIVTHALGSCIAVIAHDAVAGVGGLLHIMLPEASLDPNKAHKNPYMFADSGIPRLFHELYAHGGEKKRIQVCLAGGAQVMDPNGVFNIGKRNHLACRKTLWAAGVMVRNEAVGGNISRTVRLEVGSGRVVWNTGGGESRELAAPSLAASLGRK